MNPGRELDALIAEKVMGVPIEFVKSGLFDSEPITFNPIGAIIRYRVADYSTDIAAAWEIVEKLKISVLPPGSVYAGGEYGNSSDLWDCEVKKHDAKNWSDSVNASAETAPHAICLAALKAVGIKLKQEKGVESE